MDTHILDRLWTILQERRNADPAKSYVASLYASGTKHIARKVIEEAGEVVAEALDKQPDKLKTESADLIFHLMVLWASQGIQPEDVFKILEERFGTGGLDEKKSRKIKPEQNDG